MISKPLCGTIVPYTDESLYSFIARLAEANVFPSTSKLLSHRGIAIRRLASLPFTQEGISAVCELAPNSEGSITSKFHIPDPADPRRVEWFGAVVDRELIESRKRRISPTSLLTGKYHRAMWLLRPIHFCGETMTWLVDHCSNCGRTLQWERAVGIDVCEGCGEVVAGEDGRLPVAFHSSAAEIVSLVAVEEERRAAIVQTLPSPFNGMAAGDVFSCAVEFAAIHFHLNNRDKDPQRQAISQGNYSCLGRDGIFKGWDTIKRWPDSMMDLAGLDVGSPQYGSLREKSIGVLSRYFDPRTRDSSAKEVIQQFGPSFLRNAGVACNRSRNFQPDEFGRNVGLTQTEVRKEYGLSGRALTQLADEGICLIGKQDRHRGTQIFDREGIEDLLRRSSRAISSCELVRRIGCPELAVGQMIQAGLITPLDDRGVLIAAQDLAFDSSTPARLLPDLGDCEEAVDTSSLEPLTSVLANQLSLVAWVCTFEAIREGCIRCQRGEGANAPIADQLLVDRQQVEAVCNESNHEIPNITITAVDAGNRINAKSFIFNEAVRMGIISDLSLPEVIRMRNLLLLPSEIQSWFFGNSWEFKKSMKKQGAKPYAQVASKNLWLRSEVERVHPESAKVKFYREWCHSS